MLTVLRSKLIACCKLYVLIEGDILTEIDESSSETILFGKSSAYAILQAKPGLLAPEGQTALGKQIDCMVRSRGHLNEALQLYTPTNAYARPSELMGPMSDISAKLERWYNGLPETNRFARKPSPLKAAQMSHSLSVRPCT